MLIGLISNSTIAYATDDGTTKYYLSLEATEIYNNKVTVTAYISGIEQIGEKLDAVGGIQVVLNYDNTSFLYTETINSVYFSSALSYNSDGKLIFVCDNINGITITENTELFSTTFSVVSNATIGDHSFYLTCQEIYAPNASTTDISFDDTNAFTSVWVGEKLSIIPNDFTISLGATMDLYINKEYSTIYSTNPNVVTVDSNGTVTAIAQGNAYIVAIGGLNGTEVARSHVVVKDKSVYLMNIKTYPSKLQYEIGETADLTGLVLNVSYNNNDFEIVTNGFECGEYDFSVAGYTEIKILYKNAWINVTAHVGDDYGINSEYYDSTSDYITGVTGNTTTFNFLNNLNEKAYVAVYRGENQVTTGNIATGMTAVLTVNGNTVEAPKIIVSYDINSDGYSDLRDLVRLKKAAAKDIELDDAQLLAAGVTESTPVATDVGRLRKYLLFSNDL